MKVFSKPLWDHYTTDYTLISWLFLRGLALIYFSAFASMAVQIEGLVGADGILPVVAKLALVEQVYPEQKLGYLPTVFWFNASDFMLKLVCYLGMGAASLLLLNILTRTSLVVCYILYLSIVVVGQDFTEFQWDIFLLEIGFLAILLTWGSGIIVLLFRWLLARFMFMGGVVKIASGDASWANLSALSFHYQTQPLPTPVAYYAHQLPVWFHKLCAGGVFFIELVVPFFVFMPRRFRLFSCYAFLLLQSVIIVTGNYNFFNLLTILLCLFLLEDQDIAKLFPNRLSSFIQQQKAGAGSIANTCAGVWAGVVMLVCATQIWLYHVNSPTFESLKSLLRTTTRYSLVNNYGPFSVMTTQRNEIIIQGSNDALHWSDYQFKYKPGKLNRELSWNVPHQPRLDWQMWFSALGSASEGSWFDRFLNKLLEGSPQVLSLLEENPFADKPPVYIRAMIYPYSFTTSGQRDNNGLIWQRQQGRIYWPIRTIDTVSALRIQKQRYLDDLEFISKMPRSPGTAHHKEVRNLCADRFKALGFQVQFHDYGSGINVIGVYPGNQKPSEQIMVSAHYDSVPACNGADDNASGIAGVFETARLLVSKQHDRTLVVACWDQEENVTVGSKAFVVRARNNNSDIKMSYVYEMIGYKSDEPNSQQTPLGFELLYPEQVEQIKNNQNRGDFILLVYDQQARAMRSNIAEYAQKQNLSLIQIEVSSDMKSSSSIADLRRSDHSAFWDKGYPAMMITDTANFRNQNYHCVNGADNVESLDIDFAIKTINTLSETIEENLAN